MFMLRVMTYVVSYDLLLNWIGTVQFVFHEVWSDRGFVIRKKNSWGFLQIMSLGSLSTWIRIIFKYQKINKLKKTLKLDTPPTRLV